MLCIQLLRQILNELSACIMKNYLNIQVKIFKTWIIIMPLYFYTLTVKNEQTQWWYFVSITFIKIVCEMLRFCSGLHLSIPFLVKDSEVKGDKISDSNVWLFIYYVVVFFMYKIQRQIIWNWCCPWWISLIQNIWNNGESLYLKRWSLFWNHTKASGFPHLCSCIWLTTGTLLVEQQKSSWRHQMEASSALLAICAGNSSVTGEFRAQKPVTRIFDVFFDLCLNKWLSKQSQGDLRCHHAHYDITVMICTRA